MAKQISLKDISVIFDGNVAVDKVSLQVEKGDIYGVIGFSGAGKSTLVRTINLLQKPTSGSITVTNDILFEDGKQKIDAKQLQEKRRKIGMIFQHFNLLNEAKVIDNVALSLIHISEPTRQVR